MNAYLKSSLEVQPNHKLAWRDMLMSQFGHLDLGETASWGEWIQ